MLDLRVVHHWVSAMPRRCGKRPEYPMFCRMAGGRDFIVYVKTHWKVSYVQQLVWWHLHEIKLIGPEDYVVLTCGAVNMRSSDVVGCYFIPEPEHFFEVSVTVVREV